MPEVQSKILSGELSLSVASQAQSFFNKQKKKNEQYHPSAKLKLLERLENTTTRDCEKILLQLDPEVIRKDTERPLTPEFTELRLTVNAEFMQKIEELKNLLSNARAEITTQDVIAMALDQLLAKKNPMKHDKIQLHAAMPLTSHDVQKNPTTCNNAPLLPAPKVKPLTNSRANNPSKYPTHSRSRYIPKRTRNHIWQKHNGQCAYIDPRSGRQCQSKRYLHVDHIWAYSHGGSNDPENLQMLCASHNIWKADSR